MREFVVIHAEDPAIYQRAVSRMKAQGWHFEAREKRNDAGSPTGEMIERVADPSYWIVVGDAWIVWQWEPGESPHPGWVLMQNAHLPWLP